MAVFKCKMCGGNLQVVEGTSYCTCDSCGTTQTIPKVQDEGLKNLFNRANALRMKAEFDRATELYEKILQKNDREAEAYWGLILCKYGIEYVEDPATFKQVPTCHRASYDAVVSDEDYKNALRYADDQQRKIYEKEAADIDEIQKGILALAQKESPYDVFICYKETDEDGKRTQDSVLANDIYHQLTNEGLKVFYAAITLEDKLGKEYEPYIFSALHTAKVMLVLGTKPEYLSAVWVRNEWSRFLKIMKKDHSRLLIPCYRDMDPYELPDEFAHLQAQDMSKIGFISDLIRGIKKVVDTEEKTQTGTTVVQQNIVNSTGNMDAIFKRGKMALEDHEWKKADDFFEEVLNQNAECAEAYLGKLLAKYQCENYEKLITNLIASDENGQKNSFQAGEPDTEHIAQMVEKNALGSYLPERKIKERYEGFSFSYDSVLTSRKKQKEKMLAKINVETLWTRAKRYADPKLKQQIQDGLEKLNQALDDRIAQAEKEDAAAIARIQEAYREFLKDADSRVEQSHSDALAKIEKEYQEIVAAMNKAESDWDYSTVQTRLLGLGTYKDCKELYKKCDDEIYRIRIEAAEKKKRQAKKRKTRAITATVVVIVLAVGAAVTWKNYLEPKMQYKEAIELLEAEKFDDAYEILAALGKEDEIKENKEKRAEEYLETEDFDQAYTLLEDLGKTDEIQASKEERAKVYFENGEYTQAYPLFKELGDEENARESIYQEGLSSMEEEQYAAAYTCFADQQDYKDSAQRMVSAELEKIKATGYEKGSTVSFGSYQQQKEGGKDPIEWTVLSRDGDKILLLSNKVLAGKPYMDVDTQVNWQTCSLRTWLNKDFYNDAFTEEEQKGIVKTPLVTETYIYTKKLNENTDTIEGVYEANLEWGLKTEDNVFILSALEAEKYFDTEEDLLRAPTEAADVYAGNTGYSRWWLRTHGTYAKGNSIMYIENGDVEDDESVIDVYGWSADTTYSIGVCPAIWLDLSALEE